MKKIILRVSLLIVFSLLILAVSSMYLQMKMYDLSIKQLLSAGHKVKVLDSYFGFRQHEVTYINKDVVANIKIDASFTPLSTNLDMHCTSSPQNLQKINSPFTLSNTLDLRLQIALSYFSTDLKVLAQPFTLTTEQQKFSIGNATLTMQADLSITEIMQQSLRDLLINLQNHVHQVGTLVTDYFSYSEYGTNKSTLLYDLEVHDMQLTATTNDWRLNAKELYVDRVQGKDISVNLTYDLVDQDYLQLAAQIQGNELFLTDHNLTFTYINLDAGVNNLLANNWIAPFMFIKPQDDLQVELKDLALISKQQKLHATGQAVLSYDLDSLIKPHQEMLQFAQLSVATDENFPVILAKLFDMKLSTMQELVDKFCVKTKSQLVSEVVYNKQNWYVNGQLHTTTDHNNNNNNQLD